MENNIINLIKISKNYGGVKALSGVDISIKSGEIHCLVGENGSGKSTLVKIITGVEKPNYGEIYINGKLYNNLHVLDAIREGIQVIYQDLSLYPNLTVAENIAINQLIEENYKFFSTKTIEKITKSAIDEIGFNLDLNQKVGELSVGNKQLVAICRALNRKARLIIMDEPTVALTRYEIDLLFKVILDLKKKNISTLFLTHKLSEIFQISDNVTVLRDGKKVGDFITSELDSDKLIFYMTGKKIIKENYFYDPGKDRGVLLEVNGLTKKGNFNNISFKLKGGEILGITGLLGSGRSELALSLFGLNKPDKGKVLVSGKNIKINSVQDAIKSGIVLLPEDRLNEGLFIKKPIGTNLVIADIAKYLNRLKLINYRSVYAEIDKLIRVFEIKTSSPDALAYSLSGGNQQKVALAKWVSVQPKILILDSPTVGVDVASKKNIHNIIRNLAVNENMGIILISDEIPEVMENCNRIFIMKNGEFVDEVSAECITEEEIFNKISVN